MRYGKQTLGLDITYANLRDKMEDPSKISADMYTVHTQKKMQELTIIGIVIAILAVIVPILIGIYEPGRRLRERKAKK